MQRPLQEKFLLYSARVKKDPEAFGKIYDLYAQRIYRFVFFKVSSEEEAQDITSDVFLKFWQYLLDEKGQNVNHLGALLYRIARNRVIDHYRARAMKETFSLVTEEDEIDPPDQRRLMEDTEDKIDVELLAKHLRSLKDDYREVLVMKFMDELSTNEISALLDKPSGNVRVLLHRALNALRETIKNEQKQPHGTT